MHNMTTFDKYTAANYIFFNKGIHENNKHIVFVI